MNIDDSLTHYLQRLQITVTAPSYVTCVCCIGSQLYDHMGHFQIWLIEVQIIEVQIVEVLLYMSLSAVLKSEGLV